MTSRIIDLVATTDPLADVFADAAVLQALLDVEAALARAQAAVGVVPQEAADAIGRAASALDFDAAALARAGRTSGTIAIPLVAALTARVRAADAEAARFVHWGATSQDVVDTALVLLINRALAVMAADHRSLCDALRTLSDRHADDVMLGRTLLQPAPPITFGLKVAGWLAGVARSWSRLERARREACVLQFGGASGTLAALDQDGLVVAEALSREVGLPCPQAPWHAYRDGLATLVAAAGIYTGVLGKIARDVTLLMQHEVGEAAEPGGGSSTMPQKQNPAGCAVVLAAAIRLPGLVSTMVSALPHEHERAAGAWHAEWPVIADALQTTGSALAALRGVVTGLVVEPLRMRANVDATRGTIFAERVMMKAGATLGRERAHALVKEVLARCRRTGESFADAVRDTPDLARALADDELRSLDDPAAYLGVAETLRRRLLDSARVE